MPWPLLVALGAFVAVNLLVNALLLWLDCRLLPVLRGRARVRLVQDTSMPPPVSYGWALLLTLVIAGVGWPLLAGVVAVGHAATGAPVEVVARFAAPPLSFLVPVAVFRLGLKTGWLRTLVVWLVWRVASLAQAGLAWLAGRSLLLHVFADELPPGWREWLG